MTSSRRMSSPAALALVAASFMSLPVLADEPQMSTPLVTHSFMVGGVGFVKPAYEGSNNYKVMGFPMILPRFSNADSLGALGKRLQVKGIDDIRLRAIAVSGFEFGPVAGYRSGRDETDGPLLVGLGDIDSGLLVGGYAAYRIGAMAFDAAASTQVTGHASGLQLRLGAEVEREISSGMSFSIRVGTTFADDRYMQTYFGISGEQSSGSATNLPAYDVGSGLKDVHVRVGTKLDIGHHWTVGFNAGYSRLLGDVADSPLVETADQLSGSLRLGYRLHISR